MKVGAACLTTGAEVPSDDFDLFIQASGTDRATTVLVLEESAAEAEVQRLEKWLQRTANSLRLVVLLGSTDQTTSRALQRLQLWSSGPCTHMIRVLTHQQLTRKASVRAGLACSIGHPTVTHDPDFRLQHTRHRHSLPQASASRRNAMGYQLGSAQTTHYRRSSHYPADLRIT